ncbi:hypothetical protein C8F04DRAFT_464560 [Mycena alexandri]|uniref:Transmembrane protein n=1 Tax=Mycena alexandri TaxID=1745969 RepID=A0AAD6X4W1_9AGAR|nr:hypothetical protein C8F04DRAFT_464560 [Mycena alexandri]
MSPHSPTTRIGSASPPYIPDEGLSYVDQAQKVASKPAGTGSIYRSISWILGFREKYSLLNCFIWGGALLGFCLARSVAMNPSRTSSLLPPGEWFWLGGTMYKPNLFIHIYLATFGGLGSRPSIYTRYSPTQSYSPSLEWYIPHIKLNCRANHSSGYGVLTCLSVGNISGAIVARRAFGGELNVQAGYFVMALMVIFGGAMGLVYVKRDTRRHRKWMLRMVVYFGAAITGRLITLAAACIITIVGTYYTVWRCDQVLALLSDPQISFPQCVTSGVNPAHIWVAVHASNNGGPLYRASAMRAVHGMGIWIALLLHVIGAEIYIHKTEAANHVRLDYALEPLDFSEDSTSELDKVY